MARSIGCALSSDDRALCASSETTKTLERMTRSVEYFDQKETAYEGAGCRCGRDAREDTRHRAARSSGVCVRANAHRRTDGQQSQGAGRKVEVRRGVDGLSGAGAPWPAYSGAAQSGS